MCMERAGVECLSLLAAPLAGWVMAPHCPERIPNGSGINDRYTIQGESI